MNDIKDNRADKAIALQPHREAVAALENDVAVERERIIAKNAPVIERINYALSKKDAALQACVDALKHGIKELNHYGVSKGCMPLHAAITLAQEAQR